MHEFAVFTPDAVPPADGFDKAALSDGYRLVFSGRAFTPIFYSVIRDPDTAGVIFCGHGVSVGDIAILAEAMIKNPGAVAVGQRSGINRSEALTSFIYRVFSGVRLKDAVSGFIGIPREMFCLLPLKHPDGYYMRMLLNIGRRDKIVAVPLMSADSAYTRGAAARDIFLILRQLIMTVATSLSSFAVDYFLYILLVTLTGFRAGLCYIFARVFSSQFNYALNSRVVFKSRGARPFARYYALAFCIMAVGASVTYLFSDILGFNSILCKVLIDLPLFLASFFFQKKFVFAD